MKNTFYSIDPESGYGRSPIRVKPEIEIDYFELFNQSSEIIKRNNFNAVKGKKWNDILPFYESLHFLVSEKFKNVIETYNLTGIEFFPVNINLKPEKKYFGFILKHTAGPILDKEKAMFEFGPTKFDEETWNGSDFFTLEGTKVIAISEKAKEVLENENIINLEIDIL